MRGGNRQSKACCDDQKRTGSSQRAEHPIDQLLSRHHAEIEHSLSDGIRHVPASQKSPRKFKNRRYDDGAPYGQRPRTNARPHGIGDIVRSDRPSHI